MALSYALLAALSRESLTGYDLARHFSSTAGYFWQATHQQIYRELKKLAAANLVQITVKPQKKRPDRKVYTLTPEGESALCSWLSESVEPAIVRDPLLVKLYAAGFTTPDTLIKELQRHRKLHQEKLNTYQNIEKTYFHQQPEQLSQLGIMLTLRSGLAYEKSWLEWCDEALQLLGSVRR